MLNSQNLVKWIRVFLGATFILSAVAKIYSMSFFDGLVAGQLLGDNYIDNASGYYWVQWLTRIIIAGEFMLGVAVLQEKLLKNIVLPTMLGLLVIFTLQIIYAASFQGKGYIGGNCGCFGEVIPFDNFETIVKNIVLGGLTLFVYSKYKEGRSMNLPPVVIPIAVGVVTLFTLFLTIENLEPVEPLESETVQITNETKFIDDRGIKDSSINKDTTTVVVKDSVATEKVNEANTTVSEVAIKPKEKVSSKPEKRVQNEFTRYTGFSGGKTVDLNKGTHLICLFSLTCGHCQSAFKDILDLKKAGGKPGEAYILGYGRESDLKVFWKKTGGKSPYVILEKYSEFAQLLKGESFPKIIAVKDGEFVKSWNYDTYSKQALFAHYGVEIPSREIPKSEDILTSPDSQGGGLEIEIPSNSDNGLGF